MNKYAAYYRKKSVEIIAKTSYEAQQKAANFFRAKRSYEVAIVLMERDGNPVTHSTASIG